MPKLKFKTKILFFFLLFFLLLFSLSVFFIFRNGKEIGKSPVIKPFSYYLDSGKNLIGNYFERPNIETAQAAAPDPDNCANDSVSCSGLNPIATVSWPAMPDSWIRNQEYEFFYGTNPQILATNGLTDHFNVRMDYKDPIGLPPGTAPVIRTSNTSVNLSGLAPNTTYYWAVWGFGQDFVGTNVMLGPSWEPGWIVWTLGYDSPFGTFTTGSCSPNPINDADWISVTWDSDTHPPAQMFSGQTADVTITMKNCRSNDDCSNLNTWLQNFIRSDGVPDSYRLVDNYVVENKAAADQWGPGSSNQGMNYDVKPGNSNFNPNSFTFSFRITAPTVAAATNYHFQYRMLQGGVGPFGETTPDYTITVVPAPFCNDTICNNGETCSTCPQDCGNCCGNHQCVDPGENCLTCPSDCGTCCNNGNIDPGETCLNCPQDVGLCSCQCGSAAGKTYSTAPSTNLCQAPASGSLDGTKQNPWVWTCTDASCTPKTCKTGVNINWREIQP